ncbi:unnamed protein product [Heterobilharzia americana]|nr:unnamed protein product [Heterobilharzia americana]
MVKGKFQTYFPFEKDSMTYSCLHCRAHLARHDDLISKSFQGSQGRAYLFNQAVNVRCAEAKQRVLLTGLHFVADIFCACCDTALGWKYERAFEPSQRYKEDNSWDSEWLYPLYPTGTTNTAITSSNLNNTTVNSTKLHSISSFDYRRYESGKFQSSLSSPPIPVSNSLSSTDCGVFESSTTDLFDVNDESEFIHQQHHHSHPQHQHPHHHKHHYHSNCSSASSSSSSAHTHQSSCSSLMPNDSVSLSYRLSSSLNATGWAFRIPPATTTTTTYNGSHSTRNTCLLDLSDSGRVSDYYHNSTSTSTTENMGHLNLLCSVDNNKNDSDVENNDNMQSESSNIINIDNNYDHIHFHSNTDNHTNSINDQTSIHHHTSDDVDNSDDNAHTDHEYLVDNFIKSKSLTPITVKLFPEVQNNSVSNNSNITGYSRLEGESSDIYCDNIKDNKSTHIPMDDLCLRKLSQFSTPQARRISKINPTSLRVTITSGLGKRGRRRSRHRCRASSASPSRDFLITTGSEDEESDEMPELSDFNHQSQSVVKVQD